MIMSTGFKRMAIFIGKIGRNMKFRNTSFRVKIFVIIFAAILVPMILVSSVLFKRSEQAITEKTSEVVISSINFAINNIDSALDAVTGMSKLMLTDTRLISTAEKEYKFTEEEKVQKYGGIRDLLSFFITRIKTLNMLPGIDSFYLYLPNQNTIIDSKSTYYENINENNVDFLQKLNRKEETDSWFISSPVDYYTLNKIETRLETDKLITFNKVLKSDSNSTVAVLAVNVSENFVSDFYNKIQKGIPGNFVVMDRNQIVVAYSDKKVIGTKLDKYAALNSRIEKLKSDNGSFFLKIDNQEQFVVYSISNYTKWRYIVIIPASNILGKVYEIQKFLFIILSVTALFIFGITFLLSYIFYKPLEKLVSAMQKIENRNLDVRIDDKRRDEYQKVYRGFNDMASELKNVIKDLTNEKILKKEAEIKLLQAQINPHFLYNTLESIHSIAKIKKVEEISSMVSALSKFFRISLSGGKDVVTLREAIELVINYLTIQNIRFKGKVEYKINVPEELLGCMVPKLILQPVVENAIYHGIERKKEKGELTISGEAQNGFLQIVVEDNGVGMTEDNLRDLRHSLQCDSFEDARNFALKNINRQIKLKYGVEYGIRIDSIYGKGTNVFIKLPMISRRGVL